MSLMVLSLIVLIHYSLTVTANSRNLELLDDYVQLASEVQEWSRASSVFIIFGGNDESKYFFPLIFFLFFIANFYNIIYLYCRFTRDDINVTSGT